MDYEQTFAAALTKLRQEGRYRVFADITRQQGRFPQAILRAKDGEREIEVWCSNDYLGMGQHPDTLAAMRAALDTAGAGSGGTRNISGTHHYHIALEAELAELHGKEAALLFSSGYAANEATLAVLTRLLPDCAVFSDADNHASMIEGIRHGGREKHIWRHNDTDHLAALLAAAPPSAPKLIACESVYSMSGDIAPLAAVCDLAEQYHALVFLDEVHAIGLYGAQGAGLAAQEGQAERVDIIQGTLAKAYGTQGGYIAGSAKLVDAVRSYASGFIFTTAIAPVLAAGALASVRHLRRSETRRTQLHQRAAQLKKELRARRLPVMDSPSHIVPLLVGDADLCKSISDRLLTGYDIYIQPINYPTVPRGAERLRITPSPLHDDARMTRLVNALDAIWPRR